MKFDEVLIRIGEFGTYQKVLYVTVCLPAINCGIFMLISVFTLGIPEHRCAIPGYANDTYDVCGYEHEILINETIPLDDEKNYEECHVFSRNASHYDNFNHPINAMKNECKTWVYSTEFYEKNLVTELDLVCDKKYLPPLARMLFFGGFLAGSIIFGVLSDRIGRKPTLHISFMLNLLSSIALSWAKSLKIYIFLRFLVGAACAGIFLTSYVIGMEMVGPSMRLWAGTLIHAFFAIGHVILAGVAYLVRDWDRLELYVALPNVIYLAYYWLIPESPRWLLANGKRKQAEAVLRKAAKVNGVHLREGQFLDKHENTIATEKLWHLFRSKVMVIRTLIIFFNWLVVAMVFYGLLMSAEDLDFGVHLDFLLLSCCEFPACVLCILLFNRIGRKNLHFMFMMIGGIACVVTAMVEDNKVATIVLALIGKIGASGAFASIYVFSAELYPTTVRNAGIGASSCAARIGAMAAPYIADINNQLNNDQNQYFNKKLGEALPLVIFGSASIAAGLLTLLLPETLNKNLPETIKDAENYTTNNSTYEERIPMLP